MPTDAELQTFIVQAKAATYAGDGGSSMPSRTGSHDLRFSAGDFEYLDSYLGDADFLGQEVVHWRGQPLWGMNYYGYLLQPQRLDAASAGQLIKRALTHLYDEDRFLGGFTFQHDGWTYTDQTTGDVARFSGTEHITSADGTRCYRLDYHGGRII